METVLFAMVAAMLTVYVILDGFDFGVGILHRLVAKTDDERRTVLAAIEPVWDGNEVWLVAGVLGHGVLILLHPAGRRAGRSAGQHGPGCAAGCDRFLCHWPVYGFPA